MQAAMNAFAGQDLTCIRGERLVFAGVAFMLAAGGALVLTGPNGSGKSSLLRLMAGLTRPAAGSLTWNNDDIAADPDGQRARVRYVGHLDAVKPALTVLENVRFWSSLCPAVAGARSRPEAALEALGISRLADVPGRFLSAGQRRRVNLARLIAAPAPLWLLDEPRTALDVDGMRRLEGIIAEHREGGGMLVMSLHSGDRPADAQVLDLARFGATEDATC